MSPTPWLDGIDPSKVNSNYKPPSSYWYSKSQKKAEDIAKQRAAAAEAKADAQAKADAAMEKYKADRIAYEAEQKRLAWNKQNWAAHHPVDPNAYNLYEWERDKIWIPGDKTASGVPISLFGNDQLSWKDTVAHNWEAFTSMWGSQPKTREEWDKQPSFTYTSPAGTSAGPADMAYENFSGQGNTAMDRAMNKLKAAAQPPGSALTIERAAQYVDPYGKPMSPQDYLKYVYDTDNPETRLNALTRIIDGMPIEFYTWMGFDGVLKDLMQPRGVGTNDIKPGPKAIWGDARMNFETGVISPPGETTEELPIPQGYYEGYGISGGGGGGGYYGNQYQQDPEVFFSQLVKWVI